MQRFFQGQDVARQHSQGSSNYSSNPSFDRYDDAADADDSYKPPAALNRSGRSDASPQPDSLRRVSRAGLAIPFTEIPAPSQLRDSGYVEMAFTHVPPDTYDEQQQQQSSSLSSQQKMPVLQLSSNKRVSESREKLCNDQQITPTTSWSPDVIPSSSLESATTSNMSTGSSTSPSLGSGVGSNLSLLPTTSTIGIDTLRSYSPVETQPLTMPEFEVNEHLIPGPKTYFALALCSTVLCCLPVGVLALISSQQVRRRLAERDRQRAFLSSRKAKTRSLLAIAVGTTMWTLVVVTITVTLVLKLPSIFS